MLRAWDYASSDKSLVLCPAMNTAMWTHPLTAQHLATVESFGRRVLVISPITKTLMCGDTGTPTHRPTLVAGPGAMQEAAQIAALLEPYIGPC